MADWAKNWGVTVLCNEFGAYRKNADPEARARWLTDVRGSLDAHGVGWTTWDYDGGFGVVTRENGRPVPDEMTLRALGRKTPAGGNERAINHDEAKAARRPFADIAEGCISRKQRERFTEPTESFRHDETATSRWGRLKAMSSPA